MIVVVAALKGGVGKTTTAVYLAALAAATRRTTTLVDADPQASSADWIEKAPDEELDQVLAVEAPTERLVARALERVEADEVAIVDTPPGNDRLTARAIDHADVVIVPARVGGIETARVEAIVGMVPVNVPLGLVIAAARPYTRDYQEAVSRWTDAQVPVWGSIPERVSIAAGPEDWLAVDGLDAYRGVWRRALRAFRET
ncbi:MAG TPA: ParA family protein [Acidimicrobiales bacterium]|jgi:chromosome partitioning protein